MKPELTADELRLLPPIAAGFFKMAGSDYIEIMERNIIKFNDENQPLVPAKNSDLCPCCAPSTLILSAYEALIDFMSFIIIAPKTEIDLSLKEFFDIPLDDMPLYIVERKHANPTVRCPTAQKQPDEIPTAWQVILSRWRMKIEK